MGIEDLTVPSSPGQRGRLLYSTKLQKVSMDQLPIEILLLIFSKLPPKNLAQIKCVKKLWSQIIASEIPYEPYLANIHLNEGKEEPGFIILANSKHNKPTISWKEDGKFLKICSHLFSKFDLESYALDSSCHGLLCFRKIPKADGNNQDYRARLVNPLSQHIIELPSPTSKSGYLYIRYGLGFDSAIERYKVVCLFKRKCQTEPTTSRLAHDIKFKIYTIGMSSSWRTVFNNTGGRWRTITGLYSYREMYNRAIFVGEYLYWYTTCTSWCLGISSQEKFNEHKILAFHIRKEEFRLVSLPRSLFPGRDRCLCSYLVEIKGALCLVDNSSREIDVWMMEDHGKDEWVKKYFLKLPRYFHRNYPPAEVMGSWENDNLLIKYGQSIISYDSNTNQWRSIHTQGLEDHADELLEHYQLLQDLGTRFSFYSPNSGGWALNIPKRIIGLKHDDTIVYSYTKSWSLLSHSSLRGT